MLNRIINLMKQDFDKHCDLHDDCNDCPYNSDYDAPCHCKDIKEFDWNNYLLKKVSVTNNWISVNDRLPDKDGRYLVAMKSGDGYHISTRKFKSSEPPTWWKGNVYGFWSRNTCGVRYWQPLPEPPKDNPELLKGGVDNDSKRIL